ncbi:MAG: hypothetical protein QMD32_04500 [Smithellaceae bacterium]|nr:hypothetical protein [Smithellaceae bacterium]
MRGIGDCPRFTDVAKRSCRIGTVPFHLEMVFVILALILAGCGLKTDPRPKVAAPPETIRNLSVEATPAGAHLKWRLAGEKVGVTEFRVQRAEVNPACPACPQKYEQIVTRTRGEAAAGQGDGGFGFLDREAKPGVAYRWRVSACNDRGRCSEAAPVEPGKKE